MKKIITFAGSNSSKSINQQLIVAVKSLVQEEGVDVEVLNLRDFEAPLFGADQMEANGVPVVMQSLSKKMKEADGFLISVAEHNGSMTAVLKSTFDWLSMVEQKFFFEKPTVFLSTSPGPRGGASALKHIVEIMPFRGAKITGSHSVGSFSEKVIEGKLIHGEDQDKIVDLIKSLKAAMTES